MGIAVGAKLIAQALGGKLNKKVLGEAEKIAVNLSRGLFCGRDVVKLNDSFYNLGYVKEILQPEDSIPAHFIKIPELIVNANYDLMTDLILPKTAKVHGVSARSGKVMIWTTKDERVLGLHFQSAFNTNIMHELIVTKLYENGKIDDAIKARFIEDIYDVSKPLMRHTMQKIEEAFLRYGEDYVPGQTPKE